MTKGDRILVIEEDKLSRADIASTLESAGFEVIAATSLAGGVGKLYKGYPGLVIIADELLLMNGKEDCLQLLHVNDIPVIVLGSEGDAAVALLEAGADACMSRPLHLAELVARVRSLLRRRKEEGYSTSGRHTKPCSRRRIGEVSHNSGGMSHTEFRLLSYLVLNEGRLVESSQLLNDVWNGKQVSTECLKFYVRRLRQKMAAAFGRRGQIVNQRGIGYRYSRTEQRR